MALLLLRPMESNQLRLPGDPTGIAEPHDILAAEDYAMPSGPDRLTARLRHGSARGPLLAFVAAVLAGFVVAAKRRRQ
jgi:hypothetical protein